MRPTIAEIDLSAIRHNFLQAKKHSGNAKLLSVVKADAYGHGVVEVVKTLAFVTDGFAVATVEEAVEVRYALRFLAAESLENSKKKGPEKVEPLKNIHRLQQLPIIVLSSFSCPTECQLFTDYKLTPVIHNLQQLLHLANAHQHHKSDHKNEPQPVWLKVDSGMGRWGIDCHALHHENNSDGNINNELSFLELLAQLCQNNILSVDAVMSHFACSDEVDNDFTNQQVKQFNNQLSIIKKALPEKKISISLQNSAAIMHWPSINSDWVRPGIMLYGSLAMPDEVKQNYDLLPAMTLKTKVLDIKFIAKGSSIGYGQRFITKRDSVIAYLPCGYADGYPRNIKDNTPVLIDGKRAPIVGRISMDAMAVDITDMADKVKLGDEVILWGKGLSVDDLQDYTYSIAYELLCRLGSRVPRIYIE